MLDWMTSGVHKNKPVDHSGSILISPLKSSTSCTVHSSHDFPREPSAFVSFSAFSAARLKNLYIQAKYFHFIRFVEEYPILTTQLEKRGDCDSYLKDFVGNATTFFSPSGGSW